MRKALLLSLLIAGGTAMPGQGQPAPAQTPKPAPTPATTQPRVQPAAPQTAPATTRRAAQPAGRGGLAILVTNAAGATLEGVDVDVIGPTDRAGETNASGQINFPGLQAGTYRLRFAGDSVIAFEREVTFRPGQVLSVDVSLNPAPVRAPAAAPAPTPAAPPPAAAARVTGPAGQPRSLTVVDLIEKEFVGKQPRRESLLSCSGNLRATTIQINEPLPERLYADADAAYYVIAGEGTSRVDGHESKLIASGYLSVPRGVAHAFERKGNRPLILLAVLGGEPCDTPR